MPTKPTLSEFQASISRAVMRPLGSGDTMCRENCGTAKELIRPNDRLTAFDRLQIYNQQYWWRLLGSFADDFRGLRAVLGERKFNKLAIRYLNDCGSKSWNLRDIGSALEGYVTAHPETIAPYELLSLEMIRVEWARIVAFDGGQMPALDVEKFVRRKPEKQAVGLQPYLTLLELHFPVDHMLRRVKQSEGDSTSNAMSGGLKARKLRLAAKPLAEPIYLAVHRLDLLVYYKRLEPEAYGVLTALRDGSTLEDACGLAFSKSLDDSESISRKVETWFSAWMSFGWLCEVKKRMGC